jgi:hypothetical protein
MIGSILFIHTSSPLSWIIRKVTKSQFSHVAISISDDNAQIVEADVFKRLGAKMNPYKNYEVVDVEMNESQREQLLIFLKSVYGKQYDYLFILGIFLRLIGVRRNDMWSDRSNRIMCSELVDDAFLSVGIDLVPNRATDNVTPADLYNALTQ